MSLTNAGVMALLLLALTGCSAKEVRDNLYQGVYEGSRIQQGKEMSPAERAGVPDPDYHQYEKQRQDIIEADKPL